MPIKIKKTTLGTASNGVYIKNVNNGGATVAVKIKKRYSDYIIVIGGNFITTVGSYKIYTFTTVDTSSFVILPVSNNSNVEYLLVNGGAGVEMNMTLVEELELLY